MSLINVDFDFARLDELIQARGEKVLIETAVACTCRNGDLHAALILREGKPANQRSLSCPQCQGDGFLYRNLRQIVGLVTSLDPGRNRQLYEMGYSVPGDAIFSPSLRAGYVTDFDRITMCKPEPTNEGQVIMRGAHTLEDNAQYVTDLEDNEDRLWYRPACAIWCEDSNGVVYSQGSDFVFEAKKMQWVGNQPDIGTLFTIKFTAYLEWVAYATPFDRVDRGRSLGQRVMIRKKHVTFTSDSPLDSPAYRAQKEVDFTTRTKI
jgi:hypothetical protein